MSNTLNNLMDGYNPHKQLLDQTRKLVDKWQPTGLLEGLETEHEVNGMSVLLENQARQLIDESSKAGTTANSEQWSGVALPLVRRVFGEIAAKDFVSVQPMNLPSGLVFFLNFKYGTADTSLGVAANENIHGTTSTKDTDATGGLYGVGRFGYSAKETTATLTVDVDGAAGAENVLDKGVAKPNEINFDATASGNPVHKFEVHLPDGSDENGIRAFTITDLGGGVINEYTTLSSTGTGSFFAQSSSTQAGSVTLNFHKQPTDSTRGDFEASADATETGGGITGQTDVGIPEIDVDMNSEPIVAKTRKLKAVWTPELAQDLNAYHSVDAEAELTSMLSEYISMEIDLEILDMLLANATTVERWSAKVGFEFDSVTGGFLTSNVSQNAYAYTKNEWFATLGNKIQRVSNKIHQKTLRGGANFLVCGPDIATILESIPGYNVNTDGNQSQFAMGVQQVGTLQNRFNVYKNPYMKENVILMGYRGSQFLETGAVYAPYIPLIMTPLVYDPVNFTPRKGVMTRYAKKMVRPEFYGKVIVSDSEFI